MRDPQTGAILIVDADSAERSTIRTMLAPLGHHTVEADSERAALDAIGRESFAVIVVDVRMEGLDGFEAAKRLREQTESEFTPIIFLTSFGRDELETATAYASGAVDFVFTPILAGVLRAKVSTFVKLVTRTRELERSVESVTALNAALNASEVRAQAVLENMADGIVTATESGLIESLNQSALRLFGYREDEVIGQPFRLIIAPSHQGDFSDPVTPVEPAETMGRRKDGSCFPMEVGMSRMQIGERTFAIGSIRDISGREQRAERDRVAFEEAPIGSVITDRDGRIERVNQAVCRMTGYTARELIGTQFSELAHPDDRHASAAACVALLGGASGTRRFDSRYLRRGDRLIEASVAVSAIRDDEHEVVQLFTQIEDAPRRAAPRASSSGRSSRCSPASPRPPSCTTTTPAGTRTGSASCPSRSRSAWGCPASSSS